MWDKILRCCVLTLKFHFDSYRIKYKKKKKKKMMKLSILQLNNVKISFFFTYCISTLFTSYRCSCRSSLSSISGTACGYCGLSALLVVFSATCNSSCIRLSFEFFVFSSYVHFKMIYFEMPVHICCVATIFQFVVAKFTYSNFSIEFFEKLLYH